MGNNYKATKLGDVVKYLSRGVSPSYSDFGTLVLNQKCIREMVSFKEALYTDSFKKKISNEKYLQQYDIVICSTGVGTLGRVGQIDEPITNTTVDSHVTIVRPSTEIVNPTYLGYVLKSKQKEIEFLAEGSTGQTELSRIKLSNLEISLPPLPEQKRISSILSSFDNKIELLRKENNTLEDIAQNIFKEWFVKYNFPNKDGKPYKDNGGKMVDSELGLIPEGWRVGKLGDYFPVITGKRNANHASPNGKYMFFTCSQGTLLCDEHSFDDGALLLAGNGDFNIKWYKGKFDAYQRTYVLIPHNQEDLAYLFFLMRHYLNDIVIGNRGSVISFITKGMIENFTIVIPDKQREKQINKIFSSITHQQAQNGIKIRLLTKAKNILIKELIK